MGLFYAYLMNDHNDGNHQQLITFVNRDTADEWWRAISTPPSPYVGHVERISPQFYVQSKVNASRFVSNPQFPARLQFFQKIFFTRITSSYGQGLENTTPILATEVSDHISGRWYCIRSKADPSSHWYLHANGGCAVCGEAPCDSIHVSSTYRTRFCVRVRSNAPIPDNFVMIGKDEISIAAPQGEVLHIDAEGDVKATRGYQGDTDLLFSDLKNRFVVRVERHANGEVLEYVASVGRGVGEMWELAE